MPPKASKGAKSSPTTTPTPSTSSIAWPSVAREAYLPELASIELHPGLLILDSLLSSKTDGAFAKVLWETSGLKEFCEAELVGGDGKKRAVGLNPNIRVYAYEKGAFFGPHYDDDFRDPNTGWRSEWTLLIYLSGEEDNVAGGGTAFYPSGKLTKSPLVVSLKRGRAVLHRHGDLCMLHEGQRVEKGTKWVLRSDVMFA
ncbi:oxoglutarate/iron-dependent oxygenase [Pseudohyphozyma bogoriensis]|nr:oxoglutarate/iron-dependent oxygenase [Pseudohyphozyma bogoriensis]